MFFFLNLKKVIFRSHITHWYEKGWIVLKSHQTAKWGSTTGHVNWLILKTNFSSQLSFFNKKASIIQIQFGRL
jgi:hypothetical protein